MQICIVYVRLYVCVCVVFVTIKDAVPTINSSNFGTLQICTLAELEIIPEGTNASIFGKCNSSKGWCTNVDKTSACGWAQLALTVTVLSVSFLALSPVSLSLLCLFSLSLLTFCLCQPFSMLDYKPAAPILTVTATTNSGVNNVPQLFE